MLYGARWPEPLKAGEGRSRKLRNQHLNHTGAHGAERAGQK